MPWNARKTWSTGNTLSAADMNAYMRDNLFWVGEDAPTCQAVTVVTQSIPNNAWTSINYASADAWDTANMHNPASNNTRIVVPTGGGGKYLLTANVIFAANTTGRRLCRFLRNGTTALPANEIIKDPTTGDAATTLSAQVALAAGDYVEFQVFQLSGVSLNVVFTFTPGHFTATWLRL